MLCLFGLQIHIATVSYQYLSSLCYLKIHLLRFIGFYCTSICKKCIILLCFILNHHKTLLISQIIITKICLSHKFRINSFPVFSKAIFGCRQVNQPPTNSFDHPYTAKNRKTPTQIKHWKKDLYQGSVGRGERDCDSDLNLLTSVIFRQYTAVTNLC